MLELENFMSELQLSGVLSLEDGAFFVGGQSGGGDETGDTETGEDTQGCDYYATLDGDTHDCWRLDQNCCDPA